MQRPQHPQLSLCLPGTAEESLFGTPSISSVVGVYNVTGSWSVLCEGKQGCLAEHRRDSVPVFLESQGKLCVSNRCCSPCREQEIN